MRTRKDFFSIIIPTCNARRFLISCLLSILKSPYPYFEIIIVDNGSTDGTAEAIRQKFKDSLRKIRIVSLEKNYGPALARNRGARVARGEFLGFLDSDTKVSPDWIEAARETFIRNEKIASVQCKLMLLKEPRKIDYLGEYLGNLGFLVPVAEHGESDKGQYDQPLPILAAKSAGMFIKKTVFDKIGGFDDDYFIFVEETDLGWRCHLAGYEVVFCPASVVYHYFSAAKDIFNPEFNDYLVRFHGTKNYILTLYKNLSFKYLIKILPPHLFLWLGLAGYLAIRGNISSAGNILKAIGWNIINLRRNTRKRWVVQKARVVSDDYLFKTAGLMRKRSVGDLIARFTKSQK